MKINLSLIDETNFMVHPHQVANETCLLIQPIHIGCLWQKDTLIFRSSLWNLQGEPVSLSFSKFFNWGEQPALCTPPESLKGAHLMEKIDGTTLIFSRYKGHTIIRTRGTSDARQQENGHEIDVLLAKYPKFAEFIETPMSTVLRRDDVSYIFEWVSPTNRIVINYGDEPDMVLTAIIDHVDYSYETQDRLDNFAKNFGLRRPQTYAYDSIESMKQAVTDFRGKEGVCVYFHNDQEILKFKGAWYLLLHRMKSEMSSLEKVVDVWFDQGHPSYQVFFDFVSTTFDYEVAVMARSHMSNICDAWKEVEKIVGGMQSFADKCRGMSRKDAALKIIQAYSTTNRASFVFALLDGKPLDNEKLKKLLYQVMKK
jgi:hypothetical protein